MSILLDEALKLPIPERRKLADDIYDSIDTSAEPVFLTPEQEAELARRLEDYRQNPDGNYAWEEVRDAALRR